ncbi:hypothetical protein CK203_037827 [Vitis vinifera]|uniref:Uncharacterized protein n=1 Tax=Vitis vinifera TaxID=29760 RepID=A0A438IH97_VITVI|nr:hypothetical protein CK203_037827 [Vitis vinifera]
MEDNRIFKFLADLNVEFDEKRRESEECDAGQKGPTVAIEGLALVTMGAGYNKVVAFQCKSDERPRVWPTIIPTANEAKTSPFTIEQMEYLLALLKSNLTSGTPSVSVAHTGPELEEDDWQC